MDHGKTTNLGYVYHLIFEATEPGNGRAIVLEEDTDSGEKQVYNIIEFEPGDRARAHLVLSNLEDRVLGYLASIKSQWPAAIERCRTDETRVRRIVKSFPGVIAYQAEILNLYAAPQDEPVPFS